MTDPFISPLYAPDSRYRFLEDRLAARARAGLSRTLGTRHGPARSGTSRPFIALCSNDYLGLAEDPRVIQGAKDAVSRWGTGSGSSRLIAGELGCYGDLEEALADFLGMESALLFTSGYQANLGVLGTLPGPGGLTFSDALNHASIIDGCRLGRSQVTIFPHLDTARLEQALTEAGAAERPAVVVTEGMFSMDGDLAAVPVLHQLARAHGALLVVDDAHSLGVLGGGRGIAWNGAPGGGADVLVGAFGKAFGSAGAFVAGPRLVREALINLARTFIFTTGPSPAAVGAAHAALRIMREDPGPREALLTNVRRFRDGLSAQGFDLRSSTGHIIPLVVGPADLAMRFAEALLEAGVYARAVRPPTVPEGTSRLRISISAAHRAEALDRAVEVLGRVARQLGVL